MYSKVLNYPTVSNTTNAHSRFVASSSAAVPSRPSKSSSSFNYDNLRLDDILCSVCQSVLIEPVFLPCQHLFCRNCIRSTVETTNLHCPCCRKRFGTWYRNASRANELVHAQLWQAIQRQFREHLDDENPSGSTKGHAMQQVKQLYTASTNRSIHLADPGEIGKEFKDELKRYQKELLEEKTKELVASDQYIINMYKQEGIIDLADTSSHVSVSSTTTPDLPDGYEKPSTGSHITSTLSSMAGPSSIQTQMKPSQIAPAKATVVSQSRNPTSPSSGSIISISSTSSAASGLTASSCATSSASGRYSLIKSVTQKVGRSAELLKQKVQDTILHRLTSGKLQQHQKSLDTFDLNRSELCIKPTAVHKAERRGVESDDNDGNDTDSLKSEQNHFIPIVQSMPKSSFSCNTFRRVPAIRLIPSTIITTPKKSPYRPLDHDRPFSAFKVVKLRILTPVRNPSDEPREQSANVESIPSTSKETPNRGSRRRPLKLNFTTPVETLAHIKNEDSESAPNGRPRRTAAMARAPSIRNIILSDQQRREQQIEMERRDFEFAQKLQQKLNRSIGVMQEIGRQPPRTTGYSLRRKGLAASYSDLIAHDNTNTSGSSKNCSGTVLNSTVNSVTPNSANKKKTPSQSTRKRKATSSSVENDVPSSSSPTKRVNASLKTRRQTRSKIVNETNPAEQRLPSAVPQRKSTRNKTR